MGKMQGQKRQLEKARQEKAAAKRERRQGRSAEDPAATGEAGADAPVDEVDQDEVLAQLADLHRRYAEEEIELEEFETARDELVQRLRVD